MTPLPTIAPDRPVRVLFVLDDGDDRTTLPGWLTDVPVVEAALAPSVDVVLADPGAAEVVVLDAAAAVEALAAAQDAAPAVLWLVDTREAEDAPLALAGEAFARADLTPGRLRRAVLRLAEHGRLRTALAAAHAGPPAEALAETLEAAAADPTAPAEPTPTAPAPDDPTAPAAPTAPADGPAARFGMDVTRPLLIIDDDDDLRDLMALYLESEGFEVATAAAGEEGLRLARKLAPAVITLDVEMPGMDGWDVLRALKADPELAATPVVMLTGRGSERVAAQALRYGVSNYLMKGDISVPTLREAIVTALQ